MADCIFEINIEVLRETGANLWSDFTRYRDHHNIPDGDAGLVSVMEKHVVDAYHKLLSVKTAEELERIRGIFDLARACLADITKGVGTHEQPA